MKKTFFIFIIILSAIELHSQNQEDALRYSQFNLMGTARNIGLSGAIGAVGADFSGLSVNPAGLALFRGSEFNFTPMFSLSKTESSYFGQLRDDSGFNLGFTNLGVVISRGMATGQDQTGWNMVQFGVAINRLANFSNRITTEGHNRNNSLLTGYVHQADGTDSKNLDQFTTKLAFDTDLIWVFDTKNLYYDADVYRGGVLQQISRSTSGSIDELVFGIGGNYNNKFYLGAVLGIPMVDYYSESTFIERDNKDTIYFFKSFERSEELRTSGTGFNLKLGSILRATDWLRVGLAFHSPTFYTGLRDKWNYSMKSNFDNGKNFTASAPEGQFEYELTTPMKLIGSVMLQIGKLGFVSADYEVIDYSASKLNSDSYKFFDENNEIKTKYRTANNIRLGGEIRLSGLYLRAGMASFESPFKPGVNDGYMNQASFGIGIRNKRNYFDFGYRMNSLSEKSYLYWVPDGFTSPVAENKFDRQALVLTMGWRLK